jgi:hypothetical protein
MTPVEILLWLKREHDKIFGSFREITKVVNSLPG